MGRRADRHQQNPADGRTRPEESLEVTPQEHTAVGVPGIAHAMDYALREMGPARSARTLLALNQDGGFDCPSCAWPDPGPGKRKHAEFCENGAKAVAWEATRKRVGPEFFAEHPVAWLRDQTGHWLEKQGRLSQPMYLAEGASHYRPITWDDALALIADRLRALPSPDRAAFYTSGRASNEAAFVYQLLARRLGTNNLPDCSNMCHESSGTALTQTIGIGKGTVTYEDLAEESELIIIVGQNPGTNHPRMLTALEEAKQRGARIVSVNPLAEAGLTRYKNPQTVRGLAGRGTAIADRHLAVRVGGDQALFAGLNKILVERDALDHDFLDRYTDGYAEAAASWADLAWADLEEQSGLRRTTLEALADEVASSERVIVCWAMGLTQHRNAVPTIRELVNFLLLRGNIGRPGAGACPVRGHSNVQGDRTMGVWEKMPDVFLDALGEEFDFDPPRRHGFDTVDSIRAMRDGLIDVFVALGGNFVAATPDSAVTEAALARVGLTVQIATKLNHSHLHHGREALILPCLGRSERDLRPGGEQFVTVEDSMSMVHTSRGRLLPGSAELRSEVAIVTGIGEALFGSEGGIDWRGLGEDYPRIRRHIEHVVPGFHSFEERLTQPGGFQLPNGPRDSRSFATATGKGRLTVNPLEPLEVPEGHLILQTIRSHDQFNTTIYGLDDRYRGIRGGRRVVLVNPDDLRALGHSDGDVVDLVSIWHDREGAPPQERRAPGFRVVAYGTPRHCAAAYFPEANVLVPLDSTAAESNTPTSKSVIIRLEPAG
ncbi:FdhF/YdeP family oxidoreductase [Nocardioides insulae]|uniref:FdhF/YdeP family oxidoreductase n=1 Tax=Nocardioides insulae TaxID=394734 RepID=UPI00041F0106|nr:FdhF/YdeP family oxidoreductase [Nocardioides insulae]